MQCLRDRTSNRISAYAGVFVAAYAWAVMSGGPCFAGDTTGGESSRPWAEGSVGADAAAHYWTTFSGVTVAPFGSIREDGLRLRLQGGYGQYRYQATASTAGGPIVAPFRGIKSFGEVLAGYQFGIGALTLKAFAGAQFESNKLMPADPDNPVQGAATGTKLVFESWLDLGQIGWAQLDSGWGSAEATYSSRLRLGYRLLPALSVGPEAGVIGNRAYNGARLGGFVRYEWERGEISVSGGVTGDYAKPDEPYGTLSWLTRF